MAPVHSEWWDYWVYRSAVAESVSRRRNFLFGHIARLQENVPAHKALNCHVDLSLERPPSSQWSRRPSRPCNKWVDQIWRDNNLAPADLWKRAVSRGHRGPTLGPTPVKRWRRRRWTPLGDFIFWLGPSLAQFAERNLKVNAVLGLNFSSTN